MANLLGSLDKLGLRLSAGSTTYLTRKEKSCFSLLQKIVVKYVYTYEIMVCAQRHSVGAGY